MANIKTHLNNIKNALFGNEVRGSIHDGIDAINKEVEGTTKEQQKLSDTFKNLTINAGNSNAEIVAARGSKEWLADRLDENEEKISVLEKEIKLSNIDSWRKLPNSQKCIIFIGDSTSDVRVGYRDYCPTQHIYKHLATNYICLGGVLENIEIKSWAVSGGKMREFIDGNFKSSSDNIYSLDSCIKNINSIDKIPLIIFCYGHNDADTTEQNEMINMLNECISRFTKETKSYVLLRFPNTWQIHGNTDYDRAKSNSDKLWNTYMDVVGRYSKTDHIDFQTVLFGRDIIANHPLMGDNVHPNQLGYDMTVDIIVAYINNKPINLINPVTLKKAMETNPNKPYIEYPKILDVDSRYAKIAEGYGVFFDKNILRSSIPYDFNANLKNLIVNIADKEVVELNDNTQFNKINFQDWVASKNYSEGTYCKSGDNIYYCLVPGTSGTVTPTSEGVVNDNTVTWSFRGKVDMLSIENATLLKLNQYKDKPTIVKIYKDLSK